MGFQRFDRIRSAFTRFTSESLGRECALPIEYVEFNGHFDNRFIEPQMACRMIYTYLERDAYSKIPCKTRVWAPNVNTCCILYRCMHYRGLRMQFPDRSGGEGKRC